MTEDAANDGTRAPLVLSLALLVSILASLITAPGAEGLYGAFLATLMLAIAANDDMRSPTDKDVLKEAFATANLPAEIEVYAGSAHGWCPPDSQVYNEALAEKAWSRLLDLYGKSLA